MNLKNISNKYKWDYSGIDEVCYSDDKQESYIKAAEFLGDNVEDWGGGTGWARRYFKNYTNIDGSPHKYVNQVADLVEYTSDCENILMREVLEYNTQWKRLLDNVKKSFKKRFCLIISTPFANKTYIWLAESTGKAKRIEFRFKKQDILDQFPKSKYKLNEELIKTNHLYNRDWILYVEKING